MIEIKIPNTICENIIEEFLTLTIFSSYSFPLTNNLLLITEMLEYLGTIYSLPFNEILFPQQVTFEIVEFCEALISIELIYNTFYLG